MTKTRRYPSKRVYDIPEPREKKGVWIAERSADPGKLIRSRQVWLDDVEGVAATEVRVDWQRTDHYVEFTRLHPNYLRAMKAKHSD